MVGLSVTENVPPVPVFVVVTFLKVVAPHSLPSRITFWFARLAESAPDSVVAARYLTVGGFAASETAAAAAFTVTVPLNTLFTGSVIANLPTVLKVNEYESVGFRTGDVNEHVLHATCWFFVSLLTHFTVSPEVMVTFFGTKPALVIDTVVVVALIAFAAATSAPTSAAKNKTLFIICLLMSPDWTKMPVPEAYRTARIAF